MARCSWSHSLDEQITLKMAKWVLRLGSFLLWPLRWSPSRDSEMERRAIINYQDLWGLTLLLLLPLFGTFPGSVSAAFGHGRRHWPRTVLPTNWANNLLLSCCSWPERLLRFFHPLFKYIVVKYNFWFEIRFYVGSAVGEIYVDFNYYML